MCRLAVFVVLICGICGNLTTANDVTPTPTSIPTTIPPLPPTTPTHKPRHWCKDLLEVSRNNTERCWKNILAVKINGTEKDLICRNESDYQKILKTHIENYKTKCKRTTNKNNPKDYMGLVTHSLHNETILKELAKPENLACVQRAISFNATVNNSTKLFNSTSKIHLIRKTENLHFTVRNCDSAKKVRNSIKKQLLQESCAPVVVEYVTSLFNFSAEKCEEAKQNASIVDLPPPPKFPWVTLICVVGGLVAIPAFIFLFLYMKSLFCRTAKCSSR